MQRGGHLAVDSDGAARAARLGSGRARHHRGGHGPDRGRDRGGAGLPGRTGQQRVADAHHLSAGGDRLHGHHRRDRCGRRAPSRLRLGALGRRADRHPLQHRGEQPGAGARRAFQYASESDRVGYPIPRHPRIEGGAASTGDRHVLVVDRQTCMRLRAVGRVARRALGELDGGLRRGLPPRQRRAATGGLDVAAPRGSRSCRGSSGPRRWPPG